MKFTITVDAMLNGKECINPKVEFIHGEDLLFPCEKDGNSLSFEIRPGVDSNVCIEGFIKCEDECLNCPPQYFKKCLCNDVTKLEVCQVCVDGFIEDICKAEDLALGKICTPDGCKCPPNASITDPATGQCVQCITGTKSGCMICVGGIWEDILCDNNERCVDGSCECLPGFIKDQFTNKCVSPPACTEDEDCPECFSCVLGGCVPTVCPAGYKCYKGECVLWPCIDTTCMNGGDCGTDCGCVELDGKKQCVPCAILNCEGLCQTALGCKCNGDKCVGVDNCGDYCDGSTPCLDSNCTCYNNRCVSCENFTCDDTDGGCGSYYNCGCNSAGDCTGGGGCKDKIELKKLENCNAECALEAVFTTDKGCNCDPIEFRIKNTKDCIIQNKFANTSEIYLTLKTELFKNGKPYLNFLNDLSFGNNELVQGTLSTVLRHFTKNELGIWEQTNANVLPVPVASIVDNQVDSIVISPANVQEVIDGKDTKVTIEIRANGVRIEGNGCVEYGTAAIASYELDFSNKTSTCNKVNGIYKEEQKTLLKDNISTRIPLFVYSKSTTGTYKQTKFIHNKVYEASGWIFKEYGKKVGGTWVSKLNKLSDGLVNNYNYKVSVDCGCKYNEATIQKVVFCCPKNIEYILTECGRKITVKPFDSCQLNKNLSVNAPFDTPIEVQTYYVMNVDGVDVPLREEGGILVNEKVYTAPDAIKSIIFTQRYKGNPLVKQACEIVYNETPTPLDYEVQTECGKIIVKKINGSPNIVNATIDVNGVTENLIPSNNNNTWTINTLPKVSGIYDVRVFFERSCALTKSIEVTCDPIIVVRSTRAYSQCPNGTKPDVVVEIVQGYTDKAEFQSETKGQDWFKFSSLNPIAKTFFGFDAGVHKFNVREDGVITTATVTILPTIVPIVTPTNICGTTNGVITIGGGQTGSTWRVSGLGLPSQGQNIILDSSGGGSVSIPYTGGGKYFVALVADSTGATCPQSIETTVTKDGGMVSPIIVKQSGASNCQGSEVQFRIEDGGRGLLYNVNSFGGVIKDLGGNPITTLQAISAGFNAKVELINAGSISILVNSLANNTNGCTVVTPTNSEINVLAGPIIDDITVVCFDSIFETQTYRLYLSTSGVVSGIVANGRVASILSPNLWIIDDLEPSVNGSITITATNASTSCVTTVVYDSELPVCNPEDNCPQPPQTVQIAATPESPTCGIENASIYLDYHTLGLLDGAQYAWYEVLTPTSDILTTIQNNIPNPGIITNGVVPQLERQTAVVPRSYKLKITTQGVCTFESNITTLSAGAQLSPQIIGPTGPFITGQSYNFSTGNVPGATYVWTLSNTNGLDQPIGTNSSNITVSNFSNGSNTLNLTVTTANCTGSASLMINVGLNCNKTLIVQPLNGTGSNNCKHLTGFPLSNPNSAATISHRWIVDGTPGPLVVSSSPTVNYNTDALLPGADADIQLEMSFNDGCTITSNIYTYEKCSCVCDVNNQCQQLIYVTPGSGANTPQTYTTPDNLGDLYIWFQIGGGSDAMLITKDSDSSVLLDTKMVGKQSSEFVNYQSLFYQNIGLDSSPALAIGSSIAGMTTTYQSATCFGTSITPTVTPVIASGVIANRSNNFNGVDVGIYIKIPASVHGGSSITINTEPHQNHSCVASPNMTNSHGFTVSCTPILAAGTI